MPSSSSLCQTQDSLFPWIKHETMLGTHKMSKRCGFFFFCHLPYVSFILIPKGMICIPRCSFRHKCFLSKKMVGFLFDLNYEKKEKRCFLAPSIIPCAIPGLIDCYGCAQLLSDMGHGKKKKLCIHWLQLSSRAKKEQLNAVGIFLFATLRHLPKRFFSFFSLSPTHASKSPKGQKPDAEPG